MKRLSVAVAVDGVWTTSGEGARSYQPRSDEDMKKIDALVRSAIGFDETRGDKLDVVNVQFAQEEAQTLTPEEEPFLGLGKPEIMKLIELGVLVLVALLAILMVFRPLIKRLLAPIEAAGGMPQLAGPAGAALGPAAAMMGGQPAIAGAPGVAAPCPACAARPNR